MSDCSCCKYAEWDYEEYYGTTRKQFFIIGCMKDIGDSDEYESLRRNHDQRRAH